VSTETKTLLPLGQITPAMQAIDPTPSDFLAAAFPRHGRMADPDTGTWMLEDYWMPAEGLPVSSPCDAPDCPAHAREKATAAASDAVEHLQMVQEHGNHPEDLPDYLPTRDQMLADVMQRPAKTIAKAIWATASAEPGVLLRAMAVTAS